MFKSYLRLLGLSCKQLKNKWITDPTLLLFLGILGVVVAATTALQTSIFGEVVWIFPTEKTLLEGVAGGVTFPLNDSLYQSVRLYLDAYFWALILIAAGIGFWVVEFFYRSETTKVLAQLPYRADVRFLERLTQLLLLSLTMVSVVVGVVSPSIWQIPLANLLFLALLLFCGVSVVSSVVCCAGINAYIGVNYAAPEKKGLGDVYGGPGGALLYAPAVGFGVATMTIFLFKLGTQELLRAGRVTNAFWVAYGVGALIAFWAFFSGYKAFWHSGDRLIAWFNEYDSVGFESVTEYQSYKWPKELSRLQQLLLRGVMFGRQAPTATAACLKRLTLEYKRCYPFDGVVRFLAAAGVAAFLIYLPGKSNFWAPLFFLWLFPTLIEPLWRRRQRLEQGSGWVLRSAGLERADMYATLVFFLTRYAGSALLLALGAVVGGVVSGRWTGVEVGLLVVTSFAILLLSLAVNLALNFKLTLQGSVACLGVSALAPVLASQMLDLGGWGVLLLGVVPGMIFLLLLGVRGAGLEGENV